MADKRMFSKTVTESDSFYMLSTDAQALYLHLSMNADDDGLLNNPRMIMRNCGVNEDTLNELIARGFVVSFKNGVVALTHWNLNNRIYKDKRKPTIFMDEYSRLGMTNGKYYLGDETPTVTSGFQHIQ